MKHVQRIEMDNRDIIEVTACSTEVETWKWSIHNCKGILVAESQETRLLFGTTLADAIAAWKQRIGITA